MTDVEGFGAELADFRRRVDELQAARSLPEDERLLSLDAALFELRHVAEVLWPRYEELMAAGRRGGRGDGHEQQLLRSLFQRLPVPVVLLDKDSVVRRLNPAATQLFGVRAGYAAGRSLTGSLTHDGRPVLRTQVAAVARGEGARSLRVHLLHPDSAPGGRSGASGTRGGGAGAPPHTTLRATLTELSTPQDARSGVLAVFQPVVASPEGYAGGDVPPVEPAPAAAPDLDEMSRHSELLDLVDDMTSALLTAEDTPQAVAARAAAVLHEHFADWVVVDVGDKEGLLRAVVLGPDEEVRKALLRQDPLSAPLVKDAVENGTAALQARAEDAAAFGLDAGGSAVLVRAGVGSLICVPLSQKERPTGGAARPVGDDAGAAPTRGVLTLFRTGRAPVDRTRTGSTGTGRTVPDAGAGSGRARAFELAEAGAVERMARHIALALGR